VFRDYDHPLRVAVETCPGGAVLVVDSRKDLRAASAGDVLVGGDDSVIVIPAHLAE